MQFKEIYPSLNSIQTLYMLETFGASVKLVSTYARDEICVELWTNAIDKFNSEGGWHSIELPYRGTESENTYIFSGSFMPTSEGNYQFTYRSRSKGQPQWQWAGEWGENGYLSILAPSPEKKHTCKPFLHDYLPLV